MVGCYDAAFVMGTLWGEIVDERKLRKLAVTMLLLALIPSVVTMPKLLEGPEHPRGLSIPPPEDHDPLASKVLLVILDGLPAYVMEDPEYMPNFANWGQHGAVMEVHTGDMTLSGPCSKELSTGLHAAPIDAVRNWEITYDGVDDPFHYAEAAGLDVGFTGFYIWTNLFPGEQFEHRTIYDSGFSDIYDADNQTLDVVNDWISGDGPDIMIAHLGGTDHAGHIWGVNSNEYKTKMNIIDSQLDTIRQSLPDDWALMVTADHGMTEVGGHAISTGEDAMRVYLLGTGSAFTPGSTASMTQRDISSLFVVLLDLPFPVSADARFPLDTLNLSDESKIALEKWNWEAAVARQQWLEAEGMQHADDISTDEVEWEKIPENAQKAGMLDIVAALTVFLGILFSFVFMIEIKNEHFRGTAVAASVIAGIFILNILLYTSAYDMTILGINSMWFRKAMGVVLPALATLLILTSTFREVRDRIKWLDLPINWIEHNTTTWFLGGLLAISLWQPDARLSPALFSLFLASLTIKKFDVIKRKETLWAFWGLLVFTLWEIWNYIPKVLTGLPLQQWLGIEFLYKFQQQMVESFMTENTLLAILAVFTVLWICSRISTANSDQIWWFDATLLSVVICIHSYGNTMSDWLLLFAISACALTAFIEKSKGIDIKPNILFLTLVELVVMMLIIPTWGVWPAVCTLLLNRLVKQLFDNDLIIKRAIPEEIGWSRTNHILALAIIPFILICIVWIFFAQLTMVGLLEFNPTKWVVKGGFFGARVDPPVFWMVFITILPILSAVTLVLHSWLSTSRSLSYLFVLLSFIIATNMSHLWLSYSYPEVMLMIGFSSIVIISWLGTFALASHLYSLKRTPTNPSRSNVDDRIQINRHHFLD